MTEISFISSLIKFQTNSGAFHIEITNPLMMSTNCYCGQSLPYSACCQLIHEDQGKAVSAEQLMRARYTAFVLQNIDFLYQSFHPQTRRFQKKAAIQQWAAENHWQELQIIRSTESTVEFKAIYLDSQMNLQVHQEKSTFKKLQGIWYYVDGKVTSIG